MITVTYFDKPEYSMGRARITLTKNNIRIKRNNNITNDRIKALLLKIVDYALIYWERDKTARAEVNLCEKDGSLKSSIYITFYNSTKESMFSFILYIDLV